MDQSSNDSPRRLKLLIEYDGTDFVGWQIQKNGRSVQETIQNAFKQFTGIETTVVASGRTDSGVHARGQVAHADVRTPLSCEKIYDALNGILPNDIAILEVSDVPASFHARFSARQRRYSYTISTAPCALDRRVAWYVKYHLDLDLLNECCAHLLGDHDFRAFTKIDAEVKHYRCMVHTAEWKRSDRKLIFTIQANRFLHNMVRALVGMMVDVARGYATVDDFTHALKSGRRNDAGPTAPAVGLVLEEVLYE